MNNPKTVALHNGTILHIGIGVVTCVDNSHAQIELTHGQQKMLIKLADNINYPVSMGALYEAYTDVRDSVDAMGIRDNIAKMKNTMPNCVKEAIKSVRGYGYKLVGNIEKCNGQEFTSFITQPSCAPIRREKEDRKEGKFADLVGDYYGYYLDPLGTGAVLGAYVHIENMADSQIPKLDAYAILGIRSDQLLLSNDIAEVFCQTKHSYKDAFNAVKKGLNDNDRRCSWGEGYIDANENLAIINLVTGDTGAKWTIIIDMKDYFECKRDRNSENDHYRGGLGLVLASRTIHGTVCFRLGLVRKSLAKGFLSLNSEEMKQRLKILDGSKDAIWKPLKLSNWLDKLWYDWIMH